MSAVWVSTEEGGRGSLPARCAKTGERCITRVQLRTSDLPPALEWATWARLWPRTPSTLPVPVIVSLLPSVARVHYLLRRTRDISSLAIVVLVLLALTTSGMLETVALTALLATVVTKVVVAVVGTLWAVTVRVDTTGGWLQLDHVHDDFVAAAERVTDRPDGDPVLHEASVGALIGAAGATATDT